MEEGYGAAAQRASFPHKSAFTGRRAPNVVGAVGSLVVPWLVFAATYLVTSLNLSAWLCWLLLAIVLGIGGFAAREWWKSYETGEPVSTWYPFLFLTSLIAWIAAFSLGGQNFHENMEQYLNINNLSIYQGISAERTTSAGMMDAGQVVFQNNTFLDMTKIMLFKDYDTFCVVPIVGAAAHAGSYDFWAVGLNCCSGSGPDAIFTCGDYNTPGVHSGVRVVQDDHESFYHLAVQQAEAAYKLVSTQPMFFLWANDPQLVVDSYRSNTWSNIVTSCLVAFVLQITLVLMAAGVVTKLGH